MNEIKTGNSPGTALPVGTAAKIPIIPGYGPGPRIGDLQLTVLETFRGEEALRRIQSAGTSMDSLKPGFEYVLLHLKAGYMRNGKDAREQKYQMTDNQLLASSADGMSEYPLIPFSGGPGEDLIGHTFGPEEVREGWMVCQLPRDEMRPLLIFRRENVDNVWGLWSDIWFQMG